MRRRIYEIIDASDETDKLGRLYDCFMIAVIIISLVPIAAKRTDGIYEMIDIGVAAIFAVDYVLRLCTADFKLKKGKLSFLIYPFTPMAVCDLMAFLSVVLSAFGGLRVLKVLRLLRALRVMRVFKVIRYSRSIRLILEVFRKQWDSLLVIGGLAVGYILVSALVIISVEPDTFETFFDAVYWAAISLTTVGYGDIYAVSTAGRIITIISSFFGIAIVALPAGIVTAGYLDAMNQQREEDKKHPDEAPYQNDKHSDP